MLRAGLNIDSLGNLTATKSSNRAGDADEYRLGTFFQISTFFPRKSPGSVLVP